ncbi:MAG: calcium-translocating P-type ATPase, PMCA-type [Clostridiales bacterium]|nr:calcium-translocating P-type ATPase, PMCA-type [Clostridiales bacterium]
MTLSEQPVSRVIRRSAGNPGGEASPDGGLTPSQVEQSRRQYGENTLTQKKRNGFWKQFLSSFGDPIIKILLAALAVNVLFLFHHFDWYESAGIAVAIFLATFVSTLSEYGSESAFARLQEDAAKITCRVRRSGGVRELPIGEIVVGDIILLQAGEMIPADGLLISGHLSVDQSALNGESKEADKRPGGGEGEGGTDFLTPSRLFRGAVVCSGEGAMLVKQVGDGTFYGRLARDVQEETRESPLKVRLGGLAKTLSRIGYAAALCVAVADLFHSLVLDNGMQWAAILTEVSQPSLLFGHVLHALTLAITVVVVAVPEGLPMMITVVLSSNMRRMLKDNVLVRKLVGIETSGSLNILFTDKTGTLTRGRLEVQRFIDGEGGEYATAADLKRKKPLWELAELSCVYNSGSIASGKKALGGNATDRALLEYVLPKRGIRASYRVMDAVPFDSARKYAAVHIRLEGKPSPSLPGELTLIKGAPERILSRCTRYYAPDGTVKPLRSGAQLRSRLDELTRHAVRMLALAVSDTPVGTDGPPSDLILIGLAGIRDEVRPDARKAVSEVRGAGVQVVMITGDNRETAAAIAKEAGLIDGREKGAVITSAELAELSDEQLQKRLPALRVVARALPEDKSRLVRAAQSMGLVAGMTGDGINDAPALKLADVGFAMGSGTEVAKEAGDIVILDDNISSISRAILYGRTIFKSIRKFIVFQLTMNLCAVGVSVIGPFIGIDTPVTVIQMLWINIIMDTLAGLAFAGEPPLEEYMREPPKRRDEPVLNRYMLHQIVLMGLFTVALCVAFLKLPAVKLLFRYANDYIYFMTAFFALFIFTGIFNSFNARTHRLNLLAHIRGNPLFIFIMAMVAVVQLLLIYYGGSLFRTAGLTFGELKTVLMIAFWVIPADLLRKLVLRLFKRKGSI